MYTIDRDLFFHRHIMPTIYKRAGQFYHHDGSRVTDPDMLQYARGLVIPPAYRDVEIYYRRGTRPPKIMYMGTDAAGREQYIYAPWWAEQQRDIKLCSLIRFGELLPRIQTDITAHLRRGGRWTQTRSVALILRIIGLCYFRIGNTKYERLYKSHGISTVSKRHLIIDDAGARFSFVGKRAQTNECVIVDPLTIASLSNLVSHVGGDGHIFKYQSGGHWHHVRHTDVNDYLKVYDPVLTSKMFRTWDTNAMLIDLLPDPVPLTSPARRRALVAVFRNISSRVHNTMAICRKSYADPDLAALYLEHPRKYRTLFVTPDSTTRTKLLGWLRSRCD